MRETFLLVDGRALLKRIKTERISRLGPGSHSRYRKLHNDKILSINFRSIAEEVRFSCVQVLTVEDCWTVITS